MGLDGGKGGGDAPAAPDPYKTADAVTKANAAAARYNKFANLPNYSGPFGSQTSSIIGYDPTSGAPISSTSTSINPQLQAAINAQFGNLANAQDINAGNQSEATKLYWQSRGLTSGDARQQGQDAYYKAASSYLDPKYSMAQESLQAKLAAQGLAPDSQAYKNAMGEFERSKAFDYSQAMNSAITQGQQMGLSDLAAQRDAIAQSAGLLGQRGSIAEAGYRSLPMLAGLIPGQQQMPITQVSPADVGSYINNQYQGQLGAWNAQQQSSNNMMSGLFGLGGTLGAAAIMSDRRVKSDIKLIGFNGETPVYSYRYFFSPETHIGVMAQEAPSHAVVNVCGVMMVDYSKI